MGCTLCKNNNPERMSDESDEGDVKKEYSWDKRSKANLNHFKIENLKNETIYKLGGAINGEQFIIQNCEGCDIYLLDHINMVTIDDCTNCKMVIGPTKGSIFIRDSKDCRVVAACQQYRTRDCQRINTFLCCTTHPIIEASSHMKFGCHGISYSDLEDHFHKANLSIFNNVWYDVRDFTPGEDESNWSLMPHDTDTESLIPRPTSLAANFSFCHFVPLTLGIAQRQSHKSCLVVFFNDGHSQKRARSFINDMKCNYPEIGLLRTKEIKMDSGDARRVLQTDAYNLVVNHGPVIGLEYNAPGSIDACQKTAKSIATATGSTGLVYVSASVQSSSSQIHEFFDLSDMQIKI